MTERPRNIITTENLSKHYGELKAVDRISLNVKRGEIYGFLGLNGAGKTTTIRMLLGMVRPRSGTVHVLGQEIVPGRPGPWDKVGYLVELPFSYPELTVRENLAVISRLRGLKNGRTAEGVISLVKLDAYAEVKSRHLSLGNAQRLGLAKALLHRPEILILDEPANGLDPAGIVEIRELLKDYALNHGITVFVSSHNLAEISRTATRIGIIHRGSLVQEIDTDKLDSFLRKHLQIDTRDRQGAAALLVAQNYKVEPVEDGALKLAESKAWQRPENINRLLVEAGFPPFYLKVHREDLEDYFLRVIGETE